MIKDKLQNTQVQRLRHLIDESGKTRQEIAEVLSCDNSTITKHYNGDRSLTAEYVVKYANYFNVSTDYLLGVSNAQTTDMDLKPICDFLGCSDGAALRLKSLFTSEDNEIIEFLVKYAFKSLTDLFSALCCAIREFDEETNNVYSFDYASDFFEDYLLTNDQEPYDEKWTYDEFWSTCCKSQLEEAVREILVPYNAKVDLTRFKISRFVDELITKRIPEALDVSDEDILNTNYLESVIDSIEDSEYSNFYKKVEAVEREE